MRERRNAFRDRVFAVRPTTRRSLSRLFTRRRHHMNLITNLLAGVVHFIGWLV
ncbi:hypothetical protein [Streptomyces alkaliterrae]|uniref:Uncharacterized protein n=1 Tax=Streptomyces alkaliterrae TaxID=2213162 RepID=A0A7W3WJW3_9ACTN|nr:hypothetical protein [Streptomyces alkaliterrae]MBB1253649.1 hypothetical protein [Streptomyces alkaliterrae]MBB1258855.1 hypothetical protein [Streptomyces alkaliterrae]